MYTTTYIHTTIYVYTTTYIHTTIFVYIQLLKTLSQSSRPGLTTHVYICIQLYVCIKLYIFIQPCIFIQPYSCTYSYWRRCRNHQGQGGVSNKRRASERCRANNKFAFLANNTAGGSCTPPCVFCRFCACIFVLTCTHTHTNAHTHTLAHANAHTHSHAHAYTSTHTPTHLHCSKSTLFDLLSCGAHIHPAVCRTKTCLSVPYVYECISLFFYTHAQTLILYIIVHCSCTYTHTHIHTYTHAHIHTYTHTHIHTYTHRRSVCVCIPPWTRHHNRATGYYIVYHSSFLLHTHARIEVVCACVFLCGADTTIELLDVIRPRMD